MAHKTIFYEKRNPGMTMAEIGDALGITQERVRKILDRALKKMRGYVVQHEIEMSSLLIEDNGADNHPFKLPSKELE
jgi:DNA-directed RNA polymerase sigma subunit (sigma70/sigma32)